MNSHRKAGHTDYLLYEKTAHIYDQQRFTGRAGEWGHRRQVAILQHAARDWNGKKVLEIGCGTGRITAALARWGAEITATDISEEMLEVAEARFQRDQNLSVPEFRIMSVFDIDLDLAAYHYVIMVNVFGRLTSPREALQNISSKMSASCSLVFTFPCLTSVLFPFGLMVNARGKSIARDVTSHWYTPSAIESYCREAGLEVIGWYGNHYVPMPRLLFPTLPFFWACDRLISKSLPKGCPSVFVKCKRYRH